VILEPRKSVYFMIINKSVMKIRPEEIKNLKVQRTYLDGKKTFDKND